MQDVDFVGEVFEAGGFDFDQPGGRVAFSSGAQCHGSVLDDQVGGVAVLFDGGAVGHVAQGALAHEGLRLFQVADFVFAAAEDLEPLALFSHGPMDEVLEAASDAPARMSDGRNAKEGVVEDGEVELFAVRCFESLGFNACAFGFFAEAFRGHAMGGGNDFFIVFDAGGDIGAQRLLDFVPLQRVFRLAFLPLPFALIGQ